MLFNNPYVTICVPEEAKSLYESLFAKFRSWYNNPKIELTTFQPQNELLDKEL